MPRIQKFLSKLRVPFASAIVGGIRSPVVQIFAQAEIAEKYFNIAYWVIHWTKIYSFFFVSKYIEDPILVDVFWSFDMSFFVAILLLVDWKITNWVFLFLKSILK